MIRKDFIIACLLFLVLIACVKAPERSYAGYTVLTPTLLVKGQDTLKLNASQRIEIGTQFLIGDTL